MTADEYEAWTAANPMPEVDWTELKEEQDNTESMQTLACTAGGCEI